MDDVKYDIWSLWTINILHIEEAIKDYRGQGAGSICHDNGWRKSPITIEQAALYVAEMLKMGEIKTLYSLYHTSLTRGRLDLSACLNVDQSILSQPVEKIQRVVCSKIKKIIKDIAYKECANVFQLFIPIGLIKAYQKHYTIIGFVDEDKAQLTDHIQLAEKWCNLSNWEWDYMSDDERSKKWKSYSRDSKIRLLDRHLLKHITCKNYCNKYENFRASLAKLLLDTLKDPVCGDLSEKAEDKAAFLVYQTIVNLKERGVSSISNKWQDFLTSIRSNSERIIEVLTNADGLDFMVDTQIEIIREAYWLREEEKIKASDFIPLLKNSSKWKSPDEMKKVRYNDPIDAALCVNGISMEGAIKEKYERIKAQSLQQQREMTQQQREMAQQMLQQEEFQRTQLEAQKEQARAMNNQTNALIDAQLAQLKLQLADLERQSLSTPFNSLESWNLNSAKAQLRRDITKLEDMKK